MCVIVDTESSTLRDSEEISTARNVTAVLRAIAVVISYSLAQDTGRHYSVGGGHLLLHAPSRANARLAATLTAA